MACFWPALTCGICLFLHGPHGPRPPKESLSVSLVHLVMYWPVCSCTVPGVCDLAAVTAAWPMAVSAPHTGSRRKPERNSSWGQAKLPGLGLWPVSSHLWAPKDYNLNWSRNFELWLLSCSYWGDGLWNGSLPCSQIAQRLNKNLFPVCTSICLISLILWWQAANLCFSVWTHGGHT